LSAMKKNTLFFFVFILIISLGCRKPYCPDPANVTSPPPGAKEISINSWSKLSTTISDSLYGIEFTSSNVGYVCGTNGKAYKTTDGGTSFVQMNTGTTRGLYTIAFADTNNGFIGGQLGTLLKTSDAGTAWSSVNLGGYSGTVYYIYFETSAKGYLVGSNGGLYKTIDGGNTWTVINTGNTFQYQYVKFQTDNIGYISGYNQISHVSVLKKTTDGGITWTDINTGAGNAGITAISILNKDTICIIATYVGGVAQVLRSPDGGNTWTIAAQLSPVAFEYMQFADSEVGYISGGNKANNTGTILKTTDSGISWTVMPITSNYLEKIKIVDPSTVFVCGYDNTILKGNP
jgi:photosystem II stability/assembly factor-like uncharacterized protein